MRVVSLDELKDIVVGLTNKIDAPQSTLPTFGYSDHSGLPNIEVHGLDYHYVEAERGTESSRKTTRDLDEIIFMILDFVTFTMATQFAAQNDGEGKNFRWLAFKKQIELMRIISQSFADRLKVKYSKRLGSKFPL